MIYQKALISLVLIIAVLASVAAAVGILSNEGPGGYEYESIRGETVRIYGQGIYQHMTADVAIQGIAQDYITLFAAVPLLLIALFFSRMGSLRGRFLLAGTLFYFLVTYLFYLTMGMYNFLFLVYAVLLCCSFFALFLVLTELNLPDLGDLFTSDKAARYAGGYLIFSAYSVAFLWLSIIMPPLLDGTLFPKSLEHYTTLIVQGLNLGLLLPVSFIVGLMLFRRQRVGYLFGLPYVVFLSLMMSALTAKILAMALNGVNVIPVIFIMPTFALIAITFSVWLMRSIQNDNHYETLDFYVDKFREIKQ